MLRLPRSAILPFTLVALVAVSASAAAALAKGPRPPRSSSLAVSISTPSAGATIGGSVVWQASYTGGTPSRIDFLVDGALRSSDSSSPFRYNGDAGLLDTTALSNGTHTLALVGYKGLVKATSALAVTVSNQSPATTVTAETIDSSHVQLTWTSFPGATSYQISRDGTLVGQTSETSFKDALLWPATTYAYRVVGLGSTGSAPASLTVSGTTASLPAGGFARPFSATSFWNTPVGATAGATNSSALSAYLAAHAAYPNMTLHAWGVPVAEAHPTDTAYRVPCTFYTNCTLGAFGDFAIPLTAAPDPESDAHLAVVDPASGREWDMWQALHTDASWSASAGAAVTTTGTGIAPAGTEGADAANFPLLGGIVRPEEILQGHIDHALVFGMPGVSSAGHVCPATHHDGSTTDSSALMEGAHLQLDASVDVDALAIPQWEKTVAHALQTYGMYLRDQGGSLVIWAENPIARGYDAWAKVGLSGDSISLAGIPWDRFRALSPPC